MPRLPVGPSATTRESTCTVTVSANLEEVKQASRDWARNTRWAALDNGGSGPCIFRVTRMAMIYNGPEVAVLGTPTDSGTVVRFRARIKGSFPGAKAETARAVERFAQGVCYLLALRGAKIDPPDYGWGQGNEGRLKAIARVNEPVALALFLGCFVAGAAVGFATWHALVGLVVGGWLEVMGVIACVVRYRTVGMGAAFVIATLVVPQFICWIGLTVAIGTRA